MIEDQSISQGTFGHELREVVADIDAWAEGDVIANDGITLQESDLVRQLVLRMAGPLIRLYRERHAVYSGQRARLEIQIERERADIEAAIRGEGIRHRGRPRKEFCKNGHPQTDENREPSGRCRPCRQMRYVKAGQ